MYGMQHGFLEIQLIEDLARNASARNQTDVIKSAIVSFSGNCTDGIKCKVLSWIQVGLGNRSHQVVIDVEESDSIPITSNVPQGSVLGPILFLAYIIDLPGGISLQVRLFADDTALYLTIKGEEDSSALSK